MKPVISRYGLLLPMCILALLFTQGCKVTVPNVVDMPEPSARGAITGAKLVVGAVSQEYSSTVAAGNVISQSPAGGVVVDKGSEISLTVSKGPNSFATLVIMNESGEVIVGLNVSLSTNSDWGPNRLGSSTIPVGTSFTLGDIAPGRYDIRTRNASGLYSYAWNEPFAAGATVRINIGVKKSNEQALEVVLSDEASADSESALGAMGAAMQDFEGILRGGFDEADEERSHDDAHTPLSDFQPAALNTPDMDSNGKRPPEELGGSPAGGGCFGVKSLDGFWSRTGDLFLMALSFVVLLTIVPTSLKKP